MRWIDADINTTQSDAQINNDSANQEYNDSDEASDDSLQEDSISLVDSSEELEGRYGKTDREELYAVEAITTPEARPKEDKNSERSSPRKKDQKSKKSKVSEKRTLFE